MVKQKYSGPSGDNQDDLLADIGLKAEVSRLSSKRDIGPEAAHPLSDSIALPADSADPFEHAEGKEAEDIRSKKGSVFSEF